MPVIFDLVRQVNVSDVTFDSGKFSNINVSIPEPMIDTSELKLNSETNGVDVTSDQITAYAQADFKYTYAVLLTATGQANITFNKVKIEAQLNAGTQEVSPSGELVPKISCGKYNIIYNPDDVVITFSSGISSSIANALVNYLKASILQDVMKQV